MFIRPNVRNVTLVTCVLKMSVIQEPQGRKRFQVIISMVQVPADNNSTSLTSIRTRSKSPMSETTVSEDTAQILEDFIEGASRTNILSSASGSTLSTPAPDHPNLYWETAESRLQNERFSLIREITNAIPDSEMAHHLYDVFVTRCQGPLGNTFHTPTFLKHADRVCGNVTSVSFDVHHFASSFSMESLACFLMAVCAVILPTSDSY